MADDARRISRATRIRAAVGRHTWLLVLAALIALGIAGRAALPFALARVIERSARNYVVGTVEVGDVDLAIVRGVVTVHDLTAYGPAADPDGRPSDRWLHVGRLRLDLAWRDLFDRTLRVQRFDVEDPFVAIARAASGELDLRARLRAKEPPPASTPGQPGWQVVVEDGAIRGGRLRYRDVAVGGQERLRLELDRVETRRLALDPGRFDRPGRISVAGAVAGAPFELSLAIAPRASGTFALAGTLHGHALPLARARVWVAALGRFAGLEGTLDLDLRARRDPGRHESVSGRVAVRDLAVRNARSDAPVLAWRALTLVATDVDLRRRHAAVRSVRLDGATLAVRTAPTPSVPVVAAAGMSAAPPGEHAPAPASGPAPAPAADSAARAPSWSWAIGRVALRDGRVRLLHGDTFTSVALTARGHDVGPTAPFRLQATAELASGAVRFDGDVGLDGPRVAGALTIDALPLPAAVTATGLDLPPLEEGTLDAQLDVRAEPSDVTRTAAGTPAWAIATHGRLALADVRLAAEDAEAFSLGWDALEVDIWQVRVADGEPATVQLGLVALQRPTASLRRTAAGVVLPDWSSAAARDADDVVSPAPAAASAPAGADVGADVADTAAPPPARVTIDAVRVERGTVALQDRSVRPFYRNTLRELNLTVQDVRWPEFDVAKIEGSVLGLGSEPVHLEGHAVEDGFVLDATGTQIELAALNPYVTAYSDYAIEGGALTLGADVELELRRAAYEAQLAIRVHDLDLRSAGTEFRRDFGLSLALALSLLRDVRGDIVLSVPIRGGAEGTHVGLLATVRSALHRAVLNALATPLKLIGSLVRRHGEVVAFEPQPIAFRTASATLTAGARAQLDDLAKALTSRPELGVALRPVVLGAEMPALSAVAKLPPDAQPGYPRTPDALAAARARTVRRQLIDEYGVPAERIDAHEEPVWETVGPPRVEIELEPLGAHS